MVGNSLAEPGDAAKKKAGSSSRKKHPRNGHLNRSGDRPAGDNINLYSLERERAIGRGMAKAIDARLHFIADPAVNEYVNRIVQNIVHHSQATIPITVKVVDDDEVDGHSVPGGFIYVNSGLILATDDEATLAGVLAHEVAHVAARHGTEILTRQRLLRRSSLRLAHPGGAAVSRVDRGAAFVEPTSLMKFIRHLEREADLLAIEYTYAAGYDPGGLVQFFDKLRTSGDGSPAPIGDALVAHPSMEKRIAWARVEIATMLPEKSEYVLNTSEFEQIKARLLALTHRACRQESSKPAPSGAAPSLTKSSQ